MSCLHALQPFLVHWCVLFCILSDGFRLGIWTGPFGVHCDFSDGLFSIPLELSGQKKKSKLRHEAVQHCGGVAWSVQARILPIVANPPKFSLSCARCADSAFATATNHLHQPLKSPSTCLPRKRSPALCPLLVGVSLPLSSKG